MTLLEIGSIPIAAGSAVAASIAAVGAVRSAGAATRSAAAAQATAKAAARGERARWVSSMVPLLTKNINVIGLRDIVGTLPEHLQALSDELIVEAAAQAGAVARLIDDQGFAARFPAAQEKLRAGRR